ncbi:hypothetical protein WJX73_009857 [Symbiochloris irregularis]|uniref:Uncharacterized protein n=1 Tax=Symbiochloris irregularis TaxID=706552 RepID=A0AAW1NK57_9CHLO
MSEYKITIRFTCDPVNNPSAVERTYRTDAPYRVKDIQKDLEDSSRGKWKGTVTRADAPSQPLGCTHLLDPNVQCLLVVDNAGAEAERRKDAKFLAQGLAEFLQKPSRAKGFSAANTADARQLLLDLNLAEVDGSVLFPITAPPSTAAEPGFDLSRSLNEDTGAKQFMAYHLKQLEALGRELDCFERPDEAAVKSPLNAGSTVFDAYKPQAISTMLGACAYSNFPVLCGLTDGVQHHLMLVEGKDLIFWLDLEPRIAYFKIAGHLNSLQALELGNLQDIELEAIPEDVQR